MRAYSRRRVLAITIGLANLGTVAGCSGRPGTGPETAARGPIAQTSFFVFGDFARQVAGDVATAETLVPVGQHGHGWEPGPRVREAVLEADLFVYGMRGFQPWVDDLVRDLQADGHQVAVVEAAAGVDFVDTTEHAADHEDEDHEAGTEDDHDGIEGHDPHFWLDPVRARQAVDTIRAGFVDADPDNADTYDRAAETYRGRLTDLHDRFETTLTDRTREVVLVAGHDAFVYLHDRYDVRFEALAGLAPDDRPSPRDIERAQDLIAEHGIEYVCADPLESQRAAEQLVAETDASAVLPLTAIPGQTEAWRERAWGYADVMERVNLPTLERAVAAE